MYTSSYFLGLYNVDIDMAVMDDFGTLVEVPVQPIIDMMLRSDIH